MQSTTLHRVLLTAAITLATASQSFAVILYRSPTRNTTAPTGTLTNSGWQYQATHGSFLATPVAANWFISAAHVGGPNGLTYNGTNYSVDTSFIGSGPGYINGPNSDLRLWKIQGSFPSWAPMWDEAVDGSEVGKLMTVFGRGTQRGAEVSGFAGAPRVPGTRVPVRELKGWLWGVSDEVQAWGTNIVDQVFNAGSFGDVLGFDFDRISPLFDESALTGGDSAGGVFIQSGATWKLAGINLAVDGPFRTKPTGENFNAPLFDMGGMYIADTPPFLVPDGSVDVPSSSYSTRIASNLAWIRSVIGPGIDPVNVPEPATGSSVLFAGAITLLRRKRIS